MNRYFDASQSQRTINMSSRYRQVLSSNLSKIDELVDATNRHILTSSPEDANRIYTYLIESVDFILNTLELTLNNIGLLKESIDT